MGRMMRNAVRLGNSQQGADLRKAVRFSEGSSSFD